MKAAAVTLLVLQSATMTYAFASMSPLIVRRNVPLSTTLGMSELSEVGVDPVQGQRDQVDVFENDGMFSWMIPFMGMMGMDDGKVLKYGILTSEPSDEGRESSSPEEVMAAREQAMNKMTNIGMKERRRRDQVGNILIPLTAGYAVVSALLLDDGTIVGRLARFAIVLPLFLTRGYKLSAETGLCNVAQKGLWDVDDTGLTKIDDPTLARKFVDRVNAMNIETGLQAIGLATVFAGLPHSMTQATALIVVLSAVLYLLQDKVPSEVK